MSALPGLNLQPADSNGRCRPPHTNLSKKLKRLRNLEDIGWTRAACPPLFWSAPHRGRGLSLEPSFIRLIPQAAPGTPQACENWIIPPPPATTFQFAHHCILVYCLV